MPTRFIRPSAVCLGLFALGCGDAGSIDDACTSNGACPEDQFCAAGFCADTSIGVCTPRPLMCDDTEFNPVCGCDGLTYATQCFAELAGVNLASTPGACVCNGNADCVGDQFCDLDNSCINLGRCLPRPESCDPADMQEVCGCDDTTYENACVAAQAGVRVSAIGACDCQTNADCAGTQFCNAIVCDGPGVCTARPTGTCPADEEVTGCDGVIYPSACDANQSGQRVRPES